MDIQKIILNNTKDRYLLELEYTEDEEIKKEIMNIIAKLEKPLQNKIQNFNNQINEMEQLSMKKQFYRLKTPQKINLLKDYFTLHNVNSDKVEIFANEIIKMIETDVIKNKDVEYDIDNIKIIQINRIEIVNNELKYIKTKVSKKSVETKDEIKEIKEEIKQENNIKNDDSVEQKPKKVKKTK
jgi:hypothetical protein